VNPTHAVNPAMFKDSAREMNTSRQLAEKANKHMLTPADYEFNTPVSQAAGFVKEFERNKENCEMFGPSRKATPLSSHEGGRHASLQASIKAIAQIDATKAKIANDNGENRQAAMKKRNQNWEAPEPFRSSSLSNVREP